MSSHGDVQFDIYNGRINHPRPPRPPGHNDPSVIQAPRPSLGSPIPPPTPQQLDQMFRPYRIQSTCTLNCGRTYLQIFVLVLSWEDEDPRLPVIREIDQLCDVFERIYRFKTERWKIPSEDSHRSLNHKVLAFVGSDSKDHLKIVYYAGHGRLSFNRLPVWCNHYAPNDPSYRIVKWSGIQQSLEQAQSDTLLLIDSCDSGVANTDEGNGVTELLCAAGFNVTANGVGAYSFTQALITELRLLSNGRPFTVDRLYNRMLSRVQNCIPVGEEYQDPFEIIAKERHVTPIHVILTEDPLCASRRITLHPMSAETTQPPNPEGGLPMPQTPQNIRSPYVSNDDSQSPPSNLNLRENRKPRGQDLIQIEGVGSQLTNISQQSPLNTPSHGKNLEDSQAILRHEIAADAFTKACNNFDQYPKNLAHMHGSSMKEYFERLNKHEHDLFSTEEASWLSIWELQGERSGLLDKYREKPIYSFDSLKFHLERRSYVDQKDPRSRFIFITTAGENERLGFSRELLTYALTYHQVMPTFLDLLFLSNEQSQDMYSSKFRYENRLSDSDAGSCLPNLRRSGHDFRMCYTLKSPEKSSNSHENTSKWLISSVVTYHSFDAESKAAFWISIQGNNRIQAQIKNTTESHSTKNPTLDGSLAIHLLNCRWSTDEWGSYLIWLVEELQSVTCPSSGKDGSDFVNHFSLNYLQLLQELEDKATQVAMILNSNIVILEELRNFYRRLAISKKYFDDNDRDAIKQFNERIARVVRILQMHTSRTAIILQLISDGKQQIFSCLARRDSESAERIDKLSMEMQKLADLTKRETVSMRIITLVTLIFLPGTFLSTFFSTDIIKYSSSTESPAPKAFESSNLRLFILITTPLIVFTFAIFGMIYKFESRKQEKKNGTRIKFV